MCLGFSIFKDFSYILLAKADTNYLLGENSYNALIFNRNSDIYHDLDYYEREINNSFSIKERVVNRIAPDYSRPLFSGSDFSITNVVVYAGTIKWNRYIMYE